jgi:hypothetical protein
MKSFSWIVSLVLLSGCVTTSERKNAVMSVDLYWQGKNDKYMKLQGARVYPVSLRHAFVAGLGAFAALNMIVDEQDLSTGYISASAPAPVPLSSSEWNTVVANETEALRRIVSREVGLAGRFYRLDPNFKDILVNLIVSETREGSRLQLSFRLLNKTADGKPLRTQVPPTALKIGVDKFWRKFETQIESITRSVPAKGGAQYARARQEDRSAQQELSVTKSACTSAADGGRSLNEARESLAVAVRKLALAEFFGEYISSRSMVKDFVFSDEISSDSFGIVRTKGSPKFYNGESLGEICVEGRYFVTATDIEKLKPKVLSERSVCYVREDGSLEKLRRQYPAEAIFRVVTRLHPDIKQRGAQHFLPLARNLNIENERVISSSVMCADVSFEIIPLEIEYFVRREGP